MTVPVVWANTCPHNRPCNCGVSVKLCGACLHPWHTTLCAADDDLCFCSGERNRIHELEAELKTLNLLLITRQGELDLMRHNAITAASLDWLVNAVGPVAVGPVDGLTGSYAVALAYISPDEPVLGRGENLFEAIHHAKLRQLQGRRA